MTYREFFQAACALLPANEPVKVTVETWYYRNPRGTGSIVTQWEIWDHERREAYTGGTPEEALAVARTARGVGSSQMPADTDPCVVGETP